MADQFYSFDEALGELRLKEEELKRLVSEGEIRAFRDGDTMKLRRNDVENLRNELSGGDVVDLGGVSEELVFEDDADLADEAGMATEEISDVDTIIEDDVEDVGEIDLEDDEPIVTAAPVRRAGAAGGGGARGAEEEVTEGAGIKFALIATSLVLILALPLCVAIANRDGAVNNFAKAIAGIFGHEL